MTIHELKAIRERITERRDEAVSMIQGTEYLEAATAKAEAASLNWVLDLVLPRPPKARFEVRKGFRDASKMGIRDNITSLNAESIKAEFDDPDEAERMVAWLNREHERTTHV